MKKSFLSLLFIPLISFSKSSADEKMTLDGTLFKKAGEWHLFVESDQTKLKKGVFKLIGLTKTQTKKLHEREYVVVRGSQKTCDSPHNCLSVEKISPAALDPLKNRNQ